MEGGQGGGGVADGCESRLARLLNATPVVLFDLTSDFEVAVTLPRRTS
jgi:hypothetical protein